MTNRTLTATAVERIRVPATGQADHFDQGYPGLALRVSYGGAKSWVYFYRLFGKQKRLTLGRWPSMSLSARQRCRLVNARRWSLRGTSLNLEVAFPTNIARTIGAFRPRPNCADRWIRVKDSYSA